MTTPRPHWLNRQRLKVYTIAFLVCYVAAVVVLLVIRPFPDNPVNLPLGADFMAFYTASWLVLQGRGLSAYDLDTFVQAQHSLFPVLAETGYGWFYPPTTLLAVAPMALLPYAAAIVLFTGFGLVAWFVPLWQAVGRRRDALLPIVSFPGLWICVAQGQNGLLTAGLAGGAVLLLQRRPVLAGVLVGLLALKPHLALLFPVALLAARAWKAIASAAVTASVFLGVGVAVFGTASLDAWLGDLGLAANATSGGSLPLRKMPSTFALLRLLDVPQPVAVAAQVVVALAAAVVVWIVWRRSSSTALRGASLVTATFLANPYAFDYDLPWLAFPLAWLAVEGITHGWRTGDREIMVAAWVLPLLVALLAQRTGLQVAPFVLAALLWLPLRRVRMAHLAPTGMA